MSSSEGLAHRPSKKHGAASPSTVRSPPRDSSQQQQQQQQHSNNNNSNQKKHKAESTDEESEDEDEEEDSDDETPKASSSSGKHAKKRRPSGFTLKSSLNFIQVLVFGTLMMQAMTLYVSYHMLLTTQTQQNLNTQLNTAVTALSKDLGNLNQKHESMQTEINFLSRQVKAGSVVSTGAGVAAEASTTSEGEGEGEAGSSGAQEVEVVELEWLYDDGSVNKTMLEEALHKVAAESPDGPYGTPSYRAVKPGQIGGNHMMELRPHDLQTLFQYSNWTDDAKGEAYDAGAKHNQTHACMERLAQIDDNGKARDVLVVEEVRNERNMVTARDIKQGEYFFKIHEEYLLTSMVVQQSDVGQELAQSGYEAEDMVAMAVFILYEKTHSESYWKFWLNILPPSYRHMPVTFDWVEELELMDGTSCLEWVLDYQTNYRKEYLLLSYHLSALNFAQFSFAQYMWARNVVASRAFGLDVYRLKETQPAEKEGDIVEEWELVHITCMSAADLINHEGEDKKINAIWGWNENTKEFAFKARRDLPAGSALATTYGQRGNSDLLAHYGFTLPNNPYNNAWMCVNANQSDVQIDAKQKLLSDVYGDNGDWAVCELDQLPGVNCKFQNDLLGQNQQNCFQFARISVASSKQFHDVYEVAYRHDLEVREKREKAIEAGEEVEPLAAWSVFSIQPIDYNLEVRAVTRLGELAQRALRKIAGGPPAMDVAFMDASERAHAEGKCDLKRKSDQPMNWFPKGPCLTHNQLNALRVRHGEKEILEKLVRLSGLVNEFVRENPSTMAAAFDFLRRVFPQPHEMEQLNQKKIAPYFGALTYFNELFLPLHAALKGWEPPTWGEPEAGTPLHPFQLEQNRYRQYYWPDKTPEEQQLEDDRNREYNYFEPGPSSPNYSEQIDA